jgi:hypothetical protein
MPNINSSFQRWPEKKKWFWRVVIILLTVLNAWNWFHDVALGRTVAAVLDVVFILIALCVVVASFFGRGKSTSQDQ